MSGLATSAYAFHPTTGSVPKFDFSKVKTAEVCEVIINDCTSRGRFETVKALASFVATAAIAYFAYLAAAALVTSYGILATGITAIALVTLFPITLGAALIPISTLAYGIYSWSNANDYRDQVSLGMMRKAELLSGKGLMPVQV